MTALSRVFLVHAKRSVQHLLPDQPLVDHAAKVSSEPFFLVCGISRMPAYKDSARDENMGTSNFQDILRGDEAPFVLLPSTPP